MSGKLDQSLDEIMKDTKPTRGRNGRTARPRRAAATAAAKPATAAPVGGVAKRTKAPRAPRAATTAAPAVPTAPATGESKIIVSGLPEDINESQIKEYFSTTIGFVKRAMLTYGPQGRSRGIATIFFSKPASANKAVQELNGTKVDGRAIRVEVVLDARNLPGAVAPKTLSDRISKPKNAAKEKPKAKVSDAPKAAGNGTAKAERAAKKKSGRAGKPKPKTADELDAEMQDYFGGGEANGAAANGAVQPVAATNGGDTGMDEIS